MGGSAGECELAVCGLVALVTAVFFFFSRSLDIVFAGAIFHLQLELGSADIFATS